MEARTVFDFGCGCGSTAIAAGVAGGKTIIANDIDPMALIATSMNINVNYSMINSDACFYGGVDNILSNQIEVLNEKVASCEERTGKVNSDRVMLVGDMLYDEDIGFQVLDLINGLVDKEWTIYVGDPGRLFAENYLRNIGETVMEYELPKELKDQNNGMTHTRVKKIRKDDRKC